MGFLCSNLLFRLLLDTISKKVPAFCLLQKALAFHIGARLADESIVEEVDYALKYVE